MKKVSLLIFALILLLVFVACQPKEEACTHEWTAATCTAAKTCTKCNATEGAALGHDWAAATCTAAKTCKNCNETEGAPLGHTEVTLEAKAATCTATGLTAGKKCSVCNTVTVAQTTVPATGHTEVDVPGTAASCTETGLTDGKKCSVCNEWTVPQTTVGAHGHTLITLDAQEPTCTESGLTEGKKCSVCNTVTVPQETVPAAHKPVDVTGTAPTCGATGLTDGKKCSVCNEWTVPQEVIPATGAHTSTGEAIIDALCTAPTCTQPGVNVYGDVCFVCDQIIEGTRREEVVPAAGHTVESYTSNNDATCEADGTESGECTICHETDTRTVAGTALGHKMPADTACGAMWTCENGCGVPQGPREHSMAPATCSAPSTCTNPGCGHTEGETLPHTAGAPVEEDVVPAKCEEAGSYNSVTYCSVCNAFMSSEAKTIAALGHNMSAATCDAPSTCENGCGKSEGEKVANHTPVATVDGNYVTYSCTTCGDTFTTDKALIYDGTNKDYMFSKGQGSDIAMKAEDGQYNVLAGDGAVKSQYMLYLPSNSKNHANTMTGWNSNTEAFGVFSFRVNLNVALKNEAFRVIVMSSRDNSKWDDNGAWSGNSIDILAFMPNFDGDTFNGTYRVYGNSMTSNTFATVNANEWVDVKMFMQINADGLFTISYYINGEFCNVYTRDLKDPNASMSIKNLDINCAYICGWTNPGTGFSLDDVYVGYAEHTEWLFDEHKHAWAEATCESAKHCTACGLVEGEALGHTNATRNDNVVAPDCVNPGSHDVVTYCSTCNKVFNTDQVVDPATGHNFGTDNKCTVCGTEKEHVHNLVAAEVIAPTCTEGGYTVYRCNCGLHENKDETAATGHTTVVDPAVDPTCTAAGKTEGSHCSVCNTVLTAQESVAATGHKYSAPSCAAAETCTVCGATKGTPNAAAHNLTSTYADGKLTYTCSRCDYNFKVDTFDYSDGTNYNGMHANAATNNGVYTTNGSNYPVQKDGYLEFIRTEESAGAQKQVQLWLPSANGGTNKFSGFTSASNSIGYLAFSVDAKTDVNFEMKLVDNRVDFADKNGDGVVDTNHSNENPSPDYIRWGDLWAINEPVFRVMPAESNGDIYIRGFNGVQLAVVKANEEGFTGWVDVAIQIVLDPETDKVIAHYYINGEYVTTASRDLTTHTNAIQGVYINFNSKAAGCGYRIDDLTFGYSAHKHDFETTVENGVLSYNCACGTEFVCSTEVREWDGEGTDAGISHGPNGKWTDVKEDGTWGFMFTPTEESDWKTNNGGKGGQFQPWLPSSSRDANVLSGFSTENNALGVISFTMKSSVVRCAETDTSITLGVGKPRSASDWNDSDGDGTADSWTDDFIQILYMGPTNPNGGNGLVLKGGVNSRVQLATIPVGEDGWSEWFNVMIVIDLDTDGTMTCYYYVNGQLCGSDTRNLGVKDADGRFLNPQKIEAMQFSGWTYAENTGVIFDDLYFGYTAGGHNTLDGHVHKLTETTCGAKSTCSCGWTGYTVAHSFATDCAPACSVCGAANEHATAHANLVATGNADGVSYVCAGCNYCYTVKGENLHTLGDASDATTAGIYDKTYTGTSLTMLNNGTDNNAQHQFWFPGQTESPEFADCKNANGSTVFLSFSINAKDHHNTGIEFKFNANRNQPDAGNFWSDSSVGVFKIKPWTEGATSTELTGYNGATLGTIALTGENGWSGWMDVVVVMHLNKDNTVTVEYYVNGSLFKTLHADMVIHTNEVNSLYVNGRTNGQGQGYELKNLFFGYTNEAMTEYKAPFYKSEIAGGKDALTDAALKTIVDAKLKQCDQSNPGSDPSVDLFAEGGTPVFVIAEGKDGQDVECLYVSRKVAWTGKETKQHFTEFRFALDKSKKVVSFSFDYKIDGTVETNERFTFWDPYAAQEFSTDAYVQVKTVADHGNATGGSDKYPELTGTDLVLDGEWHTMSYTFATPEELENILLNLYHFQGEILIANLVVTYE